MRHKRDLSWTNTVITAEKRVQRTASCPHLDLGLGLDGRMTCKILIYSKTVKDEGEKYQTDDR